jgi:hypothetical protein
VKVFVGDFLPAYVNRHLFSKGLGGKLVFGLAESGVL